MTVDPRELMSMPQDELPEPKTLPAGHYYGQILRYEFGPTPWNADSTSLLYTCQITEPGEDVSADDIADIDLSSMSLRPVAYEIVPDRMNVIRKLHASMGLNTKNTTDENVVESVGKRVLMTVNAKPSNRAGDDRVYNNIVFMVGAED